MSGIHGLGGPFLPTNTRRQADDGSTATVQAGESKLADLAKRLGQDLNGLIQANPQIQDINNLKPGQDIRLPQAQGPIPTMQIDMSQPAPTGGPQTMQIDMSKPQNTGGPVMFRAGDTSSRALIQNRMQAAPSGPPPSGGNTKPAGSEMPSPEGLRTYNGLPDKNGELKRIKGWTEGVENWMQDAYKTTKDYSKQSKELQAAIQNFDNAAANGQKRVDTAMKKDVPKGVEKLNQLTNGEVGRLAREYKSERQQASLALREREVAATKADASLLKVGIAQDNIEKRALEIQKKELGDKAADLQAKIDSNGKLVDKAWDVGSKIVSGDFKGLAEEVATDVTKGLISGFLSIEAKTQLTLVKARMEAVDEKLKTVTDKTLKSELEAAKKTLQASAKEIVLAEEKYNYHTNQSDQKLDQLVAHEKKHNTTTIFRETRDYNASMVRAGKQLWQESGDTLRMMNRRTITDAGAMSKRVEADRQEVRRGDAPDWAKQEFMQVSGKIQDYASKLEQWRKAQQPDLDKLQKAQDNLAQGKHMGLVDKTMDNIIDKALEGEDLSKDRTYMKQ
jgi:hypothetical protein